MPHLVRRLFPFVLALLLVAPPAAAAAPQVTPKMLSAFADPLVSATAGLHVAHQLAQQAWRGKAKAATRARGVALAASALASSKLLLAKHAGAKPSPDLARLAAAIDAALAETRAVPRDAPAGGARKAALAVSTALPEGEVLLAKRDPHGVTKARAAAVDALIGENGLVALIGETGDKAIIGENGSKAIIGENGSEAIIGENGSEAIIGETGLVGASALIGENGLVSTVVAKARPVGKLVAASQKLSVAQGTAARALAEPRAGAALHDALHQTALANRAMISDLGRL